VSKSASSPTATIRPGALTPARFAGSWSGPVKQQPSETDTYNVSLTLTAGKDKGTVEWSGNTLNCRGILQIADATSTELTLNQGITHGACANGTVTLTQAGTNAIAFRFDGGGPVDSGILHSS
jgi:hypothetical protein